jgi:poly(A)-specific ribonuclease
MITRRNVQAATPKLTQVLAKSKFIAFDFELTGLHQDPDCRFVGLESAYEAHCKGAKSFLPVQLGLCGIEEIDNEWILRPFSISLFPAEERVFSTSTTAVSMLVEAGFDLTQWVSEGIRTVRAAEIEIKKQALLYRLKEIKDTPDSPPAFSLEPNRPQSISIPYHEDKLVVENARLMVAQWIKGSDPILEIPIDSAYHRLLLHTVLSIEFRNVYSHSSRKGDSRYVTVYKNRNDLFQSRISDLEQEISVLETLNGVRPLFDGLRNIPFIGHNSFFDILHLFQLLYSDLPEDLKVFKRKLAEKHTAFYDTRHILDNLSHTTSTVTSSALEAAVEGVWNRNLATKFSVLCPLTDKLINWKNGKSHDAGHDALLTALLFLGERELLGKDFVEAQTNKIRLTRSAPSLLDLNS